MICSPRVWMEADWIDRSPAEAHRDPREIDERDDPQSSISKLTPIEGPTNTSIERTKHWRIIYPRLSRLTDAIAGSNQKQERGRELKKSKKKYGWVNEFAYAYKKLLGENQRESQRQTTCKGRGAFNKKDARQRYFIHRDRQIKISSFVGIVVGRVNWVFWRWWWRRRCGCRWTPRRIRTW